MKSRRRSIIIKTINIFVGVTLLTNALYWLMARRTGQLYASGWISDVGSIGEVVAAVIAAIMIILQLEQEKDIEKEENRIHEAEFILKYNQIFMENTSLQDVEGKLGDRYMEREKLTEETVNENLQGFVNYLVYLEGLAPLILNKVIDLSHIDDLFAYRYFIAMNNPIIQEISLKSFPEYYRGCYKIYRIWRDYRIKEFCDKKGEKYTKLIPLCDSELDSLETYSNYGEAVCYKDYTYKKICNMIKMTDSQYYSVAKLLYSSNEEMYLKMFGSRGAALELIVEALKNNNNPIYNSLNIGIRERKGDIESVLLKVKAGEGDTCKEYMNWMEIANSNSALYKTEIEFYIQGLIDGNIEIGIDNIYSEEKKEERKKEILKIGGTYE